MIEAMLAKDTDAEAQLPGEGWVLERKIDGWRFLFWRSPLTGVVRSYAGRNGSERTGQANAIERLLEFLPPDTIIDAEVYVPGRKSPRVAHELAHGGDLLKATVFDILRVAGTDVIGLSWERRRLFLESAADGFDGELVSLMDVHRDPDGFASFHQSCLEAGFEGTVAKRVDSIYRPGKRSADWLKFKPQVTQEARVIGFVPGKGERTGTIGAIEIVMYDENGETDVVTSSGVTVEQSAEILEDPSTWLGSMVTVKHHGPMDSGKPRHPVSPILREDLNPVAA